MVEKPKPEEASSNLTTIGGYILTPGIFECLAKTQTDAGAELQLTDSMRMLLKQEKMYAFVYEGKRYDTGDKLGFLKATVEFAPKRESGLSIPCIFRRTEVVPDCIKTTLHANIYVACAIVQARRSKLAVPSIGI